MAARTSARGRDTYITALLSSSSQPQPNLSLSLDAASLSLRTVHRTPYRTPYTHYHTTRSLLPTCKSLATSPVPWTRSSSASPLPARSPAPASSVSSGCSSTLKTTTTTARPAAILFLLHMKAPGSRPLLRHHARRAHRVHRGLLLLLRLPPPSLPRRHVTPMSHNKHHQ
jgi:hypothetical protein